MQEIYNELLEKGIKKENIFLNEPMNKHTSFKIGGNADLFVKAYCVEDIKSVLKISKENNIPLFILGNGTNILVKDEGYRGIILQVKLENINIDGIKVTAQSGVKNAILSKKILDNSLKGFEFASGIPGTIGGAIKMNAGAYGSEMKDIVEEVTYMDFDGNVHTISNAECEFSYRHSRFFNEKAIILETSIIKLCQMQVSVSSSKELDEKIYKLEQLLKNDSIQRTVTTPANMESKKVEQKHKETAQPVVRHSATGEYLDYWEDILKDLKSSGKVMLYTNLINTKAKKLNDLIIGIEFPNRNK